MINTVLFWLSKDINPSSSVRWLMEKLILHNSFIQVREHAAAVLAGLMKGGDVDLVEDFRKRAYEQAAAVLKKRKQRYFIA